MSDTKPEWEEVLEFTDRDFDLFRSTNKMKIEGGFIFTVFFRYGKEISSSMCFVPDAPKDDNPEKSASDVYKDKVFLMNRIMSNAEPLEPLEQFRDSHSKNHKELLERIGQLESCIPGSMIVHSDLDNRLKTLEERLADLEDWTRKDEETIKDRIKKLEEAFENAEKRYKEIMNIENEPFKNAIDCSHKTTDKRYMPEHMKWVCKACGKSVHL